jgi:hypothetical protein
MQDLLKIFVVFHISFFFAFVKNIPICVCISCTFFWTRIYPPKLGCSFSWNLKKNNLRKSCYPIDDWAHDAFIECSQGQADAICFDLSSAFDLVPRILLLQKFSAFGLSGGYVNWFCSYLTNRQSQVPVSGILSSPFVVLSGVPQGSVLGPLLFSIFMNDLCDVINYSRYLLFADNIKIFCVIKSLNDCNRLQSDIDSVQGWYIAKFMKLNISKTSYFFLKKN